MFSRSIRFARTGITASRVAWRPARSASWLAPCDTFQRRHIGPSESDETSMLNACGVETMTELIEKTVPTSILVQDNRYMAALSESELLTEISALADKNEIFKSYLGMGYFNCHVPTVIKRGVLENPGWYTQYTPYQAEISQGRMETLFNFQSMVCELTGLEIANASLLDEPTAAGEAMSMCYMVSRMKKKKFYVDEQCNPNTIQLLKSRAAPLGIEVTVCDVHTTDFEAKKTCGVIFQYPNTHGAVGSNGSIVEKAKAAGAMTVCATDMLALTVLTPPGEEGVDIAVGSAQRMGVPLGYGGPHAAFISCAAKHMRKMPGRIIGKTIDSHGNECYRLALQTREQHIRRGKAVSNICTAQALLANMTALYGTYHGPEGLKAIANRVHAYAAAFADEVAAGSDHTIVADQFFDTVAIKLASGTTADSMVAAAAAQRINLRKLDDETVAVSLDETVTKACLDELVTLFTGNADGASNLDGSGPAPSRIAGTPLDRQSKFMQQPVFNRYHSETDMMRYMKMLENKDLSLVHDMIPLGSCTMKLNSAVEMQAVTMPGFANIHPFAPHDQAKGYHEMFEDIKDILCEVTGYDGMSLQPNSGAQGELAGLMAIRAYHKSRGEDHRDICLVPVSAHGTNPASASMAGCKIVDVKVVDETGEIDMDDVRDKLEKHKGNLAAIMITYPSTYGVFEEGLTELCDLIHEHGGQVYLDGANMNANTGLVKPGLCGADVSHLNLHKTFCIPHGGGGPGMGPIGVREQLVPFLPAHEFAIDGDDGEDSGYSISGAPYGSSLITTISWSYCRMMGSEGLKSASEVAILNANYMAARLAEWYPVRFVGRNGFCAHEFIIDVAGFKAVGIEAVDIAKRLQDYGLHAPTMSWPLSNALMIEPTESESKETLDRFCDAMISIRAEIDEIAAGKYPQDNNPLVNSPHTLACAMDDDWDKPYTRSKAAFPTGKTANKFWPSVGRVDDVYGDKNLVVRLTADGK